MAYEVDDVNWDIIFSRFFNLSSCEFIVSCCATIFLFNSWTAPDNVAVKCPYPSPKPPVPSWLTTSGTTGSTSCAIKPTPLGLSGWD